MNTKHGFTVIELIIVAVIFAAASFIFFSQKSQVAATARDDARKTSINAMYYNLEEVYYKEHGSYPRTINSENLKALDPELFKDPNGVKIGEGSSNFRYETYGCEADACKGYTLRSTLEHEADFVKESRNR